MEQDRYNWMWGKPKEGLIDSHVFLSSSPSFGDSWEEQAFAEDAAGPLGGCIWPPRSYTCSFCRREFRSAQALGGHMNIHRRDRARLKQSPSPQNNLEMLQHQHNQILNPSENICQSMVSNSKLDHQDYAFLASPYSTSSRVSILPTLNINDKGTCLTSLSSSTFIQESLKSNTNSPFLSWSKVDPEKCFKIQGLDKEKGSKVFESSCIEKKNQVKNDMSMNLNLVTRESCKISFDEKDEDVILIGCKRRRSDETRSFFPKRVLADRDQPESAVLDEQSPSSIEKLDLELRLGNRPK